MAAVVREHGFTRVDNEARPSAWVECLDTLHREPFYREYKARVRAILSPRPTGTYLELGSGVGTDAMAIGANVLVRDPASVDNVMGLRSWARAALAQGLMSDAEVQRWEALYDEVVAEGGFS